MGVVYFSIIPTFEPSRYYKCWIVCFYYSIEDISRDVRQKIADINNGKKTPQSLSKMESFLRYDKPQMKPLAGESFVLCDYKYFARVPNNYHLLYDDHYYSVLYTYYNQPAILKATMAEIRICDHNNKLICTHRRSYKEFPKYITRQEHMAPEHQYYKEVNSKDGAYFLKVLYISFRNTVTCAERRSINDR